MDCKERDWIEVVSTPLRRLHLVEEKVHRSGLTFIRTLRMQKRALTHGTSYNTQHNTTKKATKKLQNGHHEWH
jgi:hypothetical protein